MIDFNALFLPVLGQLEQVKEFVYGLMFIGLTSIFWKLLPKEQRNVIKCWLKLPPS